MRSTVLPSPLIARSLRGHGRLRFSASTASCSRRLALSGCGASFGLGIIDSLRARLFDVAAPAVDHDVAGGVVYEVEPTMGLAADAHELPALVAVTIFLAVGGLSQHSHDGVAAAAADPRLRLVHRGMSF